MAEQSRAALEKATLEADILVKTEIEKQRLVLEAEAEAEQIRRKAQGEADAILLKMQAEANGMKEMLEKQAEGFEKLVTAAGGNAADAVRMMIADKMEEIAKIQVEAIKNLKIDKVTVWDNGQNSEGGKNATANFVSGIMKTVPPMSDVFDMVGMNLPEYLGKKDAEPADAVSETPEA